MENVLQQNLRISKLACLHCMYNKIFNSSQKLYNFFWSKKKKKLVKTKTNFHFLVQTCYALKWMNILVQERDRITQHHSDSFKTVSTASAIFFQFHFIIFNSLSNARKKSPVALPVSRAQTHTSHAQMECILIFLQHFSLAFFLIRSSFRVEMSDICVVLFHHQLLNGEAHERIQIGIKCSVRAMDRANRRCWPANCEFRLLSPPFHLNRPSKCCMCHSNFSKQKCNLIQHLFSVSVKLHSLHFLFAPKVKNSLDYHRCCCCCNYSELL